MTFWRRNVSAKKQIIYAWPDNFEVEPGEWIRADLVSQLGQDVFSKEEDLENESFSFLVERRDPHGNVIKVLEDVIPSSGQAVQTAQGTPAFSVVIPVYGMHEYLRVCLHELAKTVPPGTEVVVVNDKPGEPIDWLPDGVMLVEPGTTCGFAGACNRGFEETTGRQVVFLNSDTVPRGDWLRQMRTTGRRMMAGVVGARLLYPQSEKTQHAGMFYDPDEGVFTHMHKNLPKEAMDQDEHLQAVSGACLMVDRVLFDKLGGFSTEYGRGYFEDVDLCLRAIQLGDRVAYCGSTEVLHHESISMGDKSRQEWLDQLDQAADVFRDKWPLERIEMVTHEYPAERTPRVDIVVAVHNALRQTMNCLESVLARTPDWIDWQVWVVDDYSDKFTRDTLVEFCRSNDRLRYIRNEKNLGYLPSIQKATEQSDAPWIVYLNSDVIVTDGWLAKMLNAAESDQKVAMVNPYTNNAANLSTPMPPGCGYLETDRRVDEHSELRRFDIVTPVGFCLLVEREALEECGGWDVEYYGRGYGEETDLFMRMTEAGYRSVMADDCYVLHEGGGTFSQFGDKKQFEQEGYRRFMSRWSARINPMLRVFNKQTPHQYIQPAVCGAAGVRPQVVFVFHEVTLCGGVLAVVHICNQLLEMGWDATFACTKLQESTLSRLGARFRPLVYPGQSNMVSSLRKNLRNADVVATIWVTSKDAALVCEGREDLRPAYFIQDVEYLFKFPNGIPYSSKEEVVATYDLIQRQVINSDWVQATVSEHTGRQSGHKIGIGVDPLVFYPRERGEKVRVMSHCRPSTPRRGWDFLAQVFTQLKIRYGSDVELAVYDQDPGPCPVDVNLGQLSPDQLAREMGRADIFLEGSKYQGWGMSGLEAMASGACLVTTDNMGIDNYGTDEHDCLIVSHGDVDGMLEAASGLIDSRSDRSFLQDAGRETAELFDWRYIGQEWDRWLRETR